MNFNEFSMQLSIYGTQLGTDTSYDQRLSVVIQNYLRVLVNEIR
jgi:hypothetical protein